MKVLFHGQVPKDLASPDLNEDIYSIAQDVSLIALCDGASESFDSKTWARLLVDNFFKNPTMEPGWLDDAIACYKAQFDYRKMSWSQQAAFDRGSFSTLLGIRHSTSDNLIEIVGIGDTIVLLLKENQIIDSFPHMSAADFRKRPELLATNAEYNTFFSSEKSISLHKKINIDDEKPQHLLLMTDALAEWTLRNEQQGNSSLKKLLQIRNDLELEELIMSERSKRNIRIDDATLINITFETD
jgi:hypothetical protein